MHSVGVFPAVRGTLVSLRVKDEDLVARGDILGKLDAAPLKLAVTQATAALTQAKAALTAARAGRIAPSSTTSSRSGSRSKPPARP